MFDVGASTWTAIGSEFDDSNQRGFELFGNESFFDCLFIRIVFLHCCDILIQNFFEFFVDLLSHFLGIFNYPFILNIRSFSKMVSFGGCPWVLFIKN